MFQVRNKEALKLLADRQMKKSRQRNGIAIGAVILTTVLFATLFTIGGGVLEQARQSLMRMNGGDAQVSIKFLSMPEYEKIRDAGGYKKCGYSILTGVGADERLRRVRTEVRYGEDDTAQTFFAFPTEGNMPEEKMEIALSRIVLDAMELPDELGSQIVFPIEVNGTVHEDTFTLCGIWDGDPIAQAQQVWVSRAYSEEVAPTLMTTFGEGTPYEGAVMAEVDFSNTWDLWGKRADLLKRAALPEDIPGGINPVYSEFQIEPSLILGGGILLLAILISGYLIIYNVFYISVTQDIQFYGLLKTIGASGRQLRCIVLRQAMKLSCIGIPAGLLAGYVVGKRLLPVVVGRFSFSGFEDYTVSPLVLIGAALFSLLTVYISFRSPGQIAAGVSPIEAVHYSGKIGSVKNIHNKNRKNIYNGNRGSVYKKCKNMYSVNGKGQRKKWSGRQRDASLILGFRNLRSEGKKSILVVVSLFLSLTLLNTTYTVLRGFDLEQFVKSYTNGDFEVTDWTVNTPAVYEKNLEGIDREFEEAVSQMPGLTRLEKVYCEEGWSDLSENVLETLGQEAKQGKYSDSNWLAQSIEMGQDVIQIYAASDTLVESLDYEAGAFDAEKWETGKYLIYYDIQQWTPHWLYQAGDKLRLEGNDGQKKEYTVMAVGELPSTMTARKSINLGISVILPEQEFVELYGEKQPLCVVYDVEDSYREEAEKRTEQLVLDSNKVYISFETLKQEFQQTKLAYSLIGGVVSLVLGAIGILNFINILAAGTLARQKELAMLSAVGMGGRQMKKMLFWESVGYIGGAVILAVTAGNFISWLLCQSETIQNQWAFVYHFTCLPILACLPVLLAVAVVIPLVFYKKICRKSVVERLRYV